MTSRRKFSRQAIYGISDKDYIKHVNSAEFIITPLRGMLMVLRDDFTLLHSQRRRVTEYYRGSGTCPLFCTYEGQEIPTRETLENLANAIDAKIVDTEATIEWLVRNNVDDKLPIINGSKTKSFRQA